MQLLPMKKISTPSVSGSPESAAGVDCAESKSKSGSTVSSVGPRAMTLSVLRQFARIYTAAGGYHPSLRGFVAN